MDVRDLDAIVEKRRESVGGDLVAFSFSGKRFEFPHPLFADDAWKEGLADIVSDVELGQYVLGDQYEEFIAAGGRSSYLAILLEELQREAQDQDREGRPTRSPISLRDRQKRQKRT